MAVFQLTGLMLIRKVLFRVALTAAVLLLLCGALPLMFIGAQHIESHGLILLFYTGYYLPVSVPVTLAILGVLAFNFIVDAAAKRAKASAKKVWPFNRPQAQPGPAASPAPPPEPPKTPDPEANRKSWASWVRTARPADAPKPAPEPAEGAAPAQEKRKCPRLGLPKFLRRKRQ